MFKVTVFEFIILSVIALIAAYEFAGLMIARHKKLTKNVSRLITHAVIFVFAALFAVYSLKWLQYFQTLNEQKLKDVVLFNWQFLAISIAMGSSMVWEFVGIYEARSSGKTKNITRLVSHGILVILFGLLFYTSMLKWQIYVSALQEPCLQKPAVSAVVKTH
ncbi:MAG: hypothetical protein A3J83_03435 [Elusimicrobia bacterium RIFOXYA2_FULL_40_6]|nr:MAG: hypothetical protein A3J83_03435 [Elusimicrobia bacterium RIFOXYA2_FULL_40_6]